ncbi:T-complex protein 11-like protein 1 isoform X2 [Anneissia japonica]|nr:T-complex protein 11-like protein 1 isoform X2 [Anneissia japonica]XP_033100506.1 T-complex protein 11-like protein 1 isoform X2 [Anneissia japonica]
MAERQNEEISEQSEENDEVQQKDQQLELSGEEEVLELGSIAASPGRNATFEELLQAADLVSNMSLVHEISVDKDFKLSPTVLPENSLEKQLRDVMHKAFWDSLQDDLHEDPPNYNRAISLLGEIKETLEMLILPQNSKQLEELNEKLDTQLIRQQAEHGVLDVHQYASYIISLMAQLCAPVRDEEIEKLKSFTDIIDLFREILRVLDLMKVDMANFTIDSLRPHIQQQSVDYERNKFSEFLKTQQDGLEMTRKWLTTVKEELATSDQPDAGVAVASRVSPMKIINGAYIKLFDWSNDTQFPETVIMDQGRFLELRDQLRRLTLVASILLITYTNVGVAISGKKGLPSKLKKEIKILLEGTNDDAAAMLNIGEYLCKEVNESLKESEYQILDSANQETLKSQLQAVADRNHSVQKLLDSRAKSFMLKMLSARGKFDPSQHVPPGLKTVEKEIIEISTRFQKLVVHNRQVYGPFYSEIISAMQSTEST